MTSNIFQSNFLTAFKVITPAHLEVLDPVVGADAASLDAVTLHKLFVLLVVTLVFCDFVNDCWSISILFSFFQITCIVLIALWSTFKSVATIARSAGAVEASQRVRALLE